jgi:ribosomal protein S18
MTTSIRLTETQRNRIYKRFETLQAFINESYKVQFARRKEV